MYMYICMCICVSVPTVNLCVCAWVLSPASLSDPPMQPVGATYPKCGVCSDLGPCPPQ